MAYPIETKDKAKRLRRQGYSIKEIARIMNIGIATSSVWLKDVSLNKRAQNRLRKLRILGQYKATFTLRAKKQKIQKTIDKKSELVINNIVSNRNLAKVYCALLFWAEGAKTNNCMQFINSSPKMITTFLSLFRNGFNINESKFRVTLHIHNYHNEHDVKKYWSNLTNIPLSQFNKCYLKPHTEIRKRPDYKGCIRISYYNSLIARELHSLYNTFATHFS